MTETTRENEQDPWDFLSRVIELRLVLAITEGLSRH